MFFSPLIKVRIFISAIESLHNGALSHPSLSIPRPRGRRDQWLPRHTTSSSANKRETPSLRNYYRGSLNKVDVSSSPMDLPRTWRTSEGYGIHVMGLLSISAYVPVHLRHTNNTAQLYAALRSIQFSPLGRYAICSNSSYIISGA